MLKMKLEINKGCYIIFTDNYKQIAILYSNATDIKVLNNPELK